MKENAFNRNHKLLLAASILILTALACTLPRGGEAALPDDGPPVAVSQAAASSFASKAMASADGSGRVSFTITQEEATSALAIGAQLISISEENPLLEGAGDIPDRIPLDQLPGDLEVTPEIEALLQRLRFGDGSGTNLSSLRLGLEEPQVYFKGDGRMIVRGYGRVLNQRLPLRLVTRPRAASGELVLDFVEGQIGRIPLPEFLFDPLGRMLSSLILAGQNYAEISQLNVGNGTLTFSATVNLENIPLQ